MESVKRHFTVNGLIFYNGKTLLLKHRKVEKWLCPGGHIEPNETPDEALLREVKEETGLDVHFMGDIDKTFGDDQVRILHSPFVVQDELINIPGDEHYHIDLIYLCTSGTDKLATEEASDIGWFTYEETEKLEMFPNFRTLLKKAFRYMKATSCVGQF
jgi:8-oxo-dGTP diphosphatase